MNAYVIHTIGKYLEIFFTYIVGHKSFTYINRYVKLIKERYLNSRIHNYFRIYIVVSYFL